MKCAIGGCVERADPDGGAICVPHQKWTAAFMRRCCRAIETAVTSEDGIDGYEAEALLREVNYWPPQKGS
jgi:hypothetical protein